MPTFLVIEDLCQCCHPGPPIVHVVTGEDKSSASQPIWEDHFDRNRKLITLTVDEAARLAGLLSRAIGKARWATR